MLKIITQAPTILTSRDSKPFMKNEIRAVLLRSLATIELDFHCRLSPMFDDEVELFELRRRSGRGPMAVILSLHPLVVSPTSTPQLLSSFQSITTTAY